MDGIELCALLAARRPELPVVVLSGYGSVSTAVSGMKAGAQDFVTKPVDFDLLARALDRAVEHGARHDEARRARGAEAGRFEDVIGASPALHRVFDLLERIRYSDASVLVTGESGTGK